MTIIPYKISIPGHLSDEFAQGFESMSIEKLVHKLVTTVYLWHADGTGLKVQSEMHDIAGWIEVGALKFSRVTGAVSGASESGVCETVVSKINLPNEFGTGLKASKLVLCTHGITIESGVVFENTGGNEIVLVAGAGPYTVAVKAPSVVDAFEPEYELSEYIREPIS
jgi:hypothetical protein